MPSNRKYSITTGQSAQSQTRTCLHMNRHSPCKWNTGKSFPILPPAFKYLSDFNKCIIRNRLLMDHHTKPLMSNKSITCQYVSTSTRNVIHNRTSTTSHQYAHISQHVLKASNGLTKKIMDETNNHYKDEWTCIDKSMHRLYFLQNCFVYKLSVLIFQGSLQSIFQ